MHFDLFDGDEPVDSIAMTKDVTVLGRALDVDIRIEHASTSRKHCEVHRDGSGWAIKDLKSSQGTHVDGAKIAPNELVKLVDGMRLRLGASTRVYKVVIAASPSAVTADDAGAVAAAAAAAAEAAEAAAAIEAAAAAAAAKTASVAADAKRRANDERVAQEQADAARAQKEREALDKAHAEKERAEAAAKEAAAKEAAERAAAEREAASREAAAREASAREAASHQASAREAASRELSAREAALSERDERERANRERVERERAERAERERVERERAERERAERATNERLERERAGRERLERERVQKEKERQGREQLAMAPSPLKSARQAYGPNGVGSAPPPPAVSVSPRTAPSASVSKLHIRDKPQPIESSADALLSPHSTTPFKKGSVLAVREQIEKNLENERNKRSDTVVERRESTRGVSPSNFRGASPLRGAPTPTPPTSFVPQGSAASGAAAGASYRSSSGRSGPPTASAAVATGGASLSYKQQDAMVAIMGVLDDSRLTSVEKAEVISAVSSKIGVR